MSQTRIVAPSSSVKVVDLVGKIEKKATILQPDFQRRFVWSNTHRQNFIDTLIKGYPTPEIYVAQNGIDIDKMESIEVVVDGQQRLTTIMDYIFEEEESKTYGTIVPKFKELDETERKNFLNYPLIVRDLGDITSEQIKEVFRRINSTQYSLKAVEIQNAVYEGEFISVAKNVLDKLAKDKIELLDFLNEANISRMGDLRYILLLQSTIEEGGYFTYDKEVEKHIKENNEIYEDGDKMFNLLLKTFKFINSLNLDADSIWLRKSSFFTMFVELSKVIDSLADKKDDLSRKVKELETKIINNKLEDKTKNKFSKFYSCLYSGTAGRNARVTRGDIFKAEVIDKILVSAP
jgi:uncharacterized protein with ParB-like and HNH nuclease domain